MAKQGMKNGTTKVLVDTDPYLEKHFRGHNNVVTGLDFNPFGDQLVSCSEDNNLIIWSTQQSVRCYKFVGHTDSILAAKYSPDGSIIASGSRDRTVRLWTPKLKGECVEFKSHTSSVRTVDFSPDGTKLATGSDDKVVKLWQVSEARFITSFVGHTNWIRCVRFSPIEKQLLSCSEDRTTRIVDCNSGENIHTFQELKGHPVHAEFHPNACIIAVGLSNGTVKLYDTRTRKLQQHYQIHDESLSQISFHPSGNYLLTASLDSSMKILDLLEGRPIYTLKGHRGVIKCVTFSHDGEQFASGGEDNNVLVWKTCFSTELRSTQDKDYSSEIEITGNPLDEKVIKNVCENHYSKSFKETTSKKSSQNTVNKMTTEPESIKPSSLKINSITSKLGKPSTPTNVLLKKPTVFQDNSTTQFENFGLLLKDVTSKLDNMFSLMEDMNTRLKKLESAAENK